MAAREGPKSGGLKKPRFATKSGRKKTRRLRFPVDAPSVARAVEDGVLMSHTALTMAAMNHIIIGALRHGFDYDPAVVASFIDDELRRLSLEQAALAEHMRGLMAEFPPLAKKSRTISDHHLLVQRRVTYSALASELDRLHGDAAFVAEAVDSSQKWAWSEIARAVESRLDAVPNPRASADYDRERIGRMREVKEIDLPALGLF